MAEPEQPAPPVWCIAANVVQQRPYGPGGEQTRRGIRLFGPGAKVWVPDGYGGMGYETVVVIGRTRHSPRYAVVSIGTEFLTNFRVKLVYSPAVLARIGEANWPGNGRGFSRQEDRSSEVYRDDLQRMAGMLQRISDEVHQQWQRGPNNHADPGSGCSTERVDSDD
jgi:hypothetical protein